MTLDPADMTIPRPDREFTEFLRQGRFMIQRSRSSGRHVFYPRVAEPGTGARDLEWVEASGLGTVYATTTIYPRAPEAPYNVVLVDLDEGPRMMSRVVSAAPDAPIGLRVRARIDQSGDTPLVLFEPVAGEQGDLG
ncbi:MAG TPA: OB-fold domain-containing protein [Novosphingobium sp.]|jgi:uncharacterized OB-fold protein|nr:OB-fold domain-containing protein [Novosphingobium sp.]